MKGQRAPYRLAVGLLAAVLLAACSGGPKSESPPQSGPSTGQVKNEVVIANSTTIKTIDPAFTVAHDEIGLARNIFSGLLKYKFNSSEVEGDLAETWGISPDGKTYTFNLRKGVQFHGNYGELTSEDVVFSFERILSSELGSNWKAELAGVKAEAVDKYTVQISLQTPYPPLVHKLVGIRQGAIVSKKAVQELGNQKFAQAPIGTGPYVFKEWLPNERVVLEANPNYFKGEPKIKRVVYKFVPDEDTARLAYRKGEADIVGAGALYRDELLAIANTTTTKINRGSFIFMMLNTEHEILKDVRVRQAIAHSIDRKAIVDHVFNGDAQVLDSFVPKGYFGYSENVPKYAYDPAKAKQLLAEAGHPNGFSVVHDTWDASSYKDPALVMKEQLAQVGITTDLTVTDQASWLTHVYAGKANMTLYLPVRSPDPDIILTQFIHSASIGTPQKGGPNATKYTAGDGLIEQARTEADPEKRKQLYEQIQVKLMQELPVIPIAMLDSPIAHHKSLKGIATYDPVWDYDFSTWYFE